MFAFLRRHPVPIEASFDYSLVLTYAFPAQVLQPLLPPGLTLDVYEGVGFVAIALVQTRALRPAGLPRFLGRDFFLSGYRIFARYRRPSGQLLRGLRILRSDADSRIMVGVGNALTHYHYHHCRVTSHRTADELSLRIQTPGQEADLALRADLASNPAAPPKGSPFPDWPAARRFAGPLPFTFDYETASRSIVLIEGVRDHWVPRPVTVQVDTAEFLRRPPFAAARPVLANSFYVENIAYRWRRGIVEKLPMEMV